MGNQWKERVHDLEWLIDRFSPVPTWTPHWKELYVESVSRHPIAQ